MKVEPVIFEFEVHERVRAAFFQAPLDANTENGRLNRRVHVKRRSLRPIHVKEGKAELGREAIVHGGGHACS